MTEKRVKKHWKTTIALMLEEEKNVERRRSNVQRKERQLRKRIILYYNYISQWQKSCDYKNLTSYIRISLHSLFLSLFSLSLFLSFTHSRSFCSFYLVVHKILP